MGALRRGPPGKLQSAARALAGDCESARRVVKQKAGAPAPVDKEDFFKGGGAKPEPDEFVIEVWSCNWRVFVIYRSCQLTHVGMSGACIGLSMQEITAALALHQIPPKRWRWYAQQLQMMGRAAAEYYADSAKKKE